MVLFLMTVIVRQMIKWNFYESSAACESSACGLVPRMMWTSSITDKTTRFTNTTATKYLGRVFVVGLS